MSYEFFGRYPKTSLGLGYSLQSFAEVFSAKGFPLLSLTQLIKIIFPLSFSNGNF